MSIRTPYQQIADRLRRQVDEPSVQPTGTPPATVAGGLGVVPGAEKEIDTTKRIPAARPLTPREADRLLTAELLAAVRQTTQQTSALTAAIGRQGSTNGVIDVALVTIPAEGVARFDYPTLIGSVLVQNHGAADTMTVQSGQPASSSTGAPTQGRGVGLVGPGERLVMAIGDRSVSVWGTAGDQVHLQAFTGLQAFGGSL